MTSAKTSRRRTRSERSRAHFARGEQPRMMLLTALGCALQIAASTLPPPLPVLVGDRRRTVPVVKSADGSLAMRADLLGDALGGEFLSDGGTRYHLLIAGTRIDVEVGSAFAR